LTEGGSNATQISLKEIGKRIVAPMVEGDDIAARAQAVLQPRILREFFEKYNRAKFPKDEIAKNVLFELGVPKERSDRALEILKENGSYAGIIQQMKTGPFVAIDNPVQSSENTEETEVSYVTEEDNLHIENSTAAQTPLFPAAKPTGGKTKQLFVAHGKNHKPLNDLKKILDQFKIPYKVAIDEPNRGRPISGKVAELMNECSAGIFVFTKDEKFFRENAQGEHDEIWRPSENVVYELGAANILWDRKIIIVREDGVNFPSDFSDLGYITFKDGEIASKALEILKELVALELVKFSAT
jgi:predicted nucleotide-binding protein